MKIKRREYILSERSVGDISALALASAKYEMPEEGTQVTPEQYQNAILVSAQAVCDSLKATYKRLPWYLKIFALKYRKFFKEGAVDFIIENTSSSELEEIQALLTEKDGSKKKAVTENQSRGKSEKN